MKRVWRFYEQNERLINLGLFLVSTTLAIVFYFYPFTYRPSLSFYVQHNSDVITLNKPIDNLKILFNEQDIRQKHLNLKVYKIRLQNDGRGDIVGENFYAEEEDLGIKVKQGRILSAYLTYPQSGFLHRNMKVQLKDSTKVLLSKLMMESGKYVEFEILVIHDADEIPILSSIGKISGQDEIPVIEEPFNSDDSIWSNIKDLILGLGAIILLLGVIALVLLGFAYLIDDIIIVKIRKSKILRLYEYPLKKLNDEKLALVSLYTDLGKKRMKSVLNDFTDINLLNEKYTIEIGDKKNVERVLKLIGDKKVEVSSSSSPGKVKNLIYKSDFLLSISFFLEKDFIKKDDDNNITVSDELLKEMRDLKDLLM